MTVEPTARCPICGSEQQFSGRYPRLLCGACVDRATDAAGRPVTVHNTATLGGATGIYADGTHAPLENLGSEILREKHVAEEFYVDGIRCLSQEAHFGGIATQTESLPDPHQPVV